MGKTYNRAHVTIDDEVEVSVPVKIALGTVAVIFLFAESFVNYLVG